VQATHVQVLGIIEVVEPGIIEHRFSTPIEEFSEFPNISDFDHHALEPVELEPQRLSDAKSGPVQHGLNTLCLLNRRHGPTRTKMYLLSRVMRTLSLGCSRGLQVCEDTERSATLSPSFCTLKAPANLQPKRLGNGRPNPRRGRSAVKALARRAKSPVPKNLCTRCPNFKQRNRATRRT